MMAQAGYFQVVYDVDPGDGDDAGTPGPANHPLFPLHLDPQLLPVGGRLDPAVLPGGEHPRGFGRGEHPAHQHGLRLVD